MGAHVGTLGFLLSTFSMPSGRSIPRPNLPTLQYPGVPLMDGTVDHPVATRAVAMGATAWQSMLEVISFACKCAAHFGAEGFARM